MADRARDGIARRGGVLPLMLRSWWAPRRVYRDLRGMPDRALIVVLMIAMLINLLAQAPLNARLAHFDPEIPFVARMGGSILAVMFMFPLLAYGMAVMSIWANRGWRRRLRGPESRLALFWALLAVAPGMLLAGLVAGMIGSGPALGLVRLVTGVGFMFIWISGMIELADK